MSEAAKLWREMVEEAEKSVEFWAAGPIVQFTEDVCRLMEEQGISRAELARRLGTSRAYITKIMSGNASFSLNMMVKVAMAVGGVVELRVERKPERWKSKPAKVVKPPKAKKARAEAQAEA
jgi:transcriptional regulator with XRE-family HTH domain